LQPLILLMATVEMLITLWIRRAWAVPCQPQEPVSLPFDKVARMPYRGSRCPQQGPDGSNLLI